MVSSLSAPNLTVGDRVGAASKEGWLK